MKIKKGSNPVRITDLTLRDGQQSLLATRMRTEDMTDLAPALDAIGFHSAEVWGGATFDVATRFLNEDPWDRPRILKKLMPNTSLQMLVRGQSLVGYRHYADDVVNAFIRHAAEVGIDIFRIFDALNDERNLKACLQAVSECGKHASLCICYSLTERKMGGPVFNLDYYVRKAGILQEMGADSICIKDMAGLLAPDDAYTLVKALKRVLDIPLQLHSHYTSGMASMSFLEAIKAGVDVIDTALAPFALRSSHPAVEPIVVALEGTPRDTGLDLTKLLPLGDALAAKASKYKQFLNQAKFSVIDSTVLEHQIPGGMISNLVDQLRQTDVLHKLDEIYREVPKVRKELGYPPLVTPTSQMVGVQAVQNVLFGRYKLVSNQITDYCYGLYGRPPAPIDSEIQKLLLKRFRRGQTPVDVRPADLLEPELNEARDAVRSFTSDIGDVLTAALYPITGLQFLKRKYGVETSPEEAPARPAGE